MASITRLVGLQHLGQLLRPTLGELSAFGVDDEVYLGGHVASGAPIDETQQAHDRQQEHRPIEQDQPKGGRTPIFSDSHAACTPSRGWFGSMAAYPVGRSSCADGPCAHL